MNKYEVGQEVLVKKPAGYPTESSAKTGCWVRDMDGLQNKKVKVYQHFKYQSQYFYYVSVPGGKKWCLREDALHPVEGKVPHVHEKLINAWAAGAEIQRYDKASSWVKKAGWVDVKTPRWEPKAKYRIKPDLKTLARIHELECLISTSQKELTKLKKEIQ